MFHCHVRLPECIFNYGFIQWWIQWVEVKKINNKNNSKHIYLHPGSRRLATPPHFQTNGFWNFLDDKPANLKWWLTRYRCHQPISKKGAGKKRNKACIECLPVMIKHSNMNLMGFFIRIKINGFRGKFADLWPGALGWKILGAQLRHHVLPSFSGHQTPKPPPNPQTIGWPKNHPKKTN